MKSRALFAACLLVSVTLVVASPSGASTLRWASVNPYCESMIADHPSPPTNNVASTYHAWAKENLKYFEHLQSEATTKIAKSSLRVLVPILRYEARSSNMGALATYVASQQVTWAREWQEFDKTVVVCAKWAVDLL